MYKSGKKASNLSDTTEFRNVLSYCVCNVKFIPLSLPYSLVFRLQISIRDFRVEHYFTVFEQVIQGTEERSRPNYILGISTL